VLYGVATSVEYLQNEFSSVSTARLIFVVPDVCSQVGNQLDMIGAIISLIISDSLLIPTQLISAPIFFQSEAD